MDEKNEIVVDFNKDYHPKPSYEGYTTSSTYTPMRDGVKIAIDIYLPEGLPPDKKVSAVLMQTRYWRAMQLRKPFKYLIKSLNKKDYIKAFTNYGYAVLSVDVRGSGASFGYRISPWSEDEVKDDKEIGYVTSGTMSPTFKKGIGMAFVKIEEAKEGNEIHIKIRKKLYRAKVVKRPFYEFRG